MPGPQPSHKRAVSGVPRAGHARPLQCCPNPINFAKNSKFPAQNGAKPLDVFVIIVLAVSVIDCQPTEHLNKAAGTQSTYRGLGSIDITAAVRSLLFIGKLKDSPSTRVLIHEKSSLAPPGQSLAFSLGDEKGFEWIGAYDITADELLAGTDTAKTESKTAQAQMLILELLADGKRMPSAELEKTVNERGISSRTMRTAKSRIGDRLVTEKDGTAWVCYLRD